MLLRKIFNLKVLLIIISFCLFNSTNATDIWWSISSDTTWTLANSPYIVTSNITVNNWVTLTIEAWVEVKFNLWTGLYSYWKILANWTIDVHIIFTSSSASPTTSDWWWIYIYNSWSNWSILDYIEVSYAKNSSKFCAVYLYDTNTILRNSLIENNWYAWIRVNSTNNHSTIENNVIQNNRYWVRVYNGSPIIRNNDVLNNSYYWIRLTSWADTVTIENNIIDWNSSYWIYIQWWINTLSSNTVQNNTSYWIYLNWWTNTLSWNTIQNNTSYWINLINWTNTINNNTIDGNQSWIYLWSYNWSNDVTWNTIQNNTEYWFNDLGLQWRVDWVVWNNTFSWNWISDYVARWISIYDTEATINWTQWDIVISWNGSLPNWKTLTISAWTIFKFVTYTNLYSYWKILANGTSEEPIIFTSINDNNVWESLWTWTPWTNDWYWLSLLWSWSNGSILDNIEVSYARNSTNSCAVYLYDTETTLSNSLIENNLYAWIKVNSTNNYPTIENNVIQNNRYWVRVYNGSPIIRNNDVLNNSYYWIRLTSWADTVTIENNIIDWNSSYWIYIQWWINTLSSNTVQNNTSYWIYLNWWTNTLSWNTIQNNTSYWINLINWTNTINNNTIDGNQSWIYLWSYNWSNDVTWNTIQNNTEYWFNDLGLQWRVDWVVWNNTFSWNWISGYVARWMNISDTEAIIDGTQWDIVIIWSGTLSNWKTLTILPWTIFKIKTSISLYSYWKILANGTSEEPIIFTSINNNSVWESLWTWTPNTSDWWWIKMSWDWSNWSILDYIEVSYARNSTDSYAIYLYDTDATISNGLIENNLYAWIKVNSTTNHPTIENNVIQNNRYWVRVYNGSPIIRNNDVLNNSYYWIRLITWADIVTIENNIIDWNNYWIYKSWWTPTIQYNLFYNNTTNDAYNITLDSTNITWQDPLFTDWYYLLSMDSPAINAWNPALWNHPISWDTYDIWAYEYSWYKTLAYWATMSWVWWRNLTYEWQIVLDPTNWSNIPEITNASWALISDWYKSCSFTVRKLWMYALKLQIWDWEELVWSSLRTFTIIN